MYAPLYSVVVDDGGNVADSAAGANATLAKLRAPVVTIPTGSNDPVQPEGSV